MVKKNASRKHMPARFFAPFMKPLALGGVALLAAATIAWLAAASLAPAPNAVLPEDALEFMLAVQTPPARVITEGEWRLAPISFVSGEGDPEIARDIPRSGPSRADVGASRRERFVIPQAGRDILASRFASPPARPRSTPREGTRGTNALPPPGAPQPRIALAIARAGIDGRSGVFPAEPGRADPARPTPASAGGGRAIRPIRPKSGAGGTLSSTSALANASGLPEQTLDDLFTLKLHGEYGTSKATLEDGGVFQDRFLRLGGKKRFDFAGMDQVDLKVDGVITTGGHWNTDGMEQDLSGIALNIGPEIKFPELPVKLDLSVGAAWLNREATLTRTGDRADIDSMVYGGGAALRHDWQWRMFTVTGLAGVQYAAATDKAHRYKDSAGVDVGPEVAKVTRSAWELPVQLRVGGEYRLLNALSVLPSLWGGYTHNITGKNGAFHSGHIAGAEMNWRRHGMTWNRSSYNFGGELRLRLVDRFEMWIAHQKEWAGNDSGSYTGGGLQIAF